MKGVLDRGGVFLAIFFGLVLFFMGGLAYLLLMLWFFALAMFVTRYEYEIKREMGLYEHERGWENVLSNGLLPSILAALSPTLGAMPFICSLAAVTADKFGSEIGVLEADDPISLFNFKKVKPWTSGAVSKIGTVGSLAGAVSIAFGAIILFKISAGQAILVTIAGFVGCIVDSLVGVLEERGIGTKGTTNFICSLVGAMVGLI